MPITPEEMFKVGWEAWVRACENQGLDPHEAAIEVIKAFEKSHGTERNRTDHL